MTVSRKQLEANKKNAQKGGVKTSEGKAIVKFNALKHGLLSKEVVITIGEGAENPEEFNTLLNDLNAQLSPEGTLEAMLVEKITVAYWRLRRAYRFEMGLIRQELDTATDDFYNETGYGDTKINKTDQEIDQEIEQEKEELKNWTKYRSRLCNMRKNGKSLKDTYELNEPWEWLHDKNSHLLPRDENGEITIWSSDELTKFLKVSASWTDKEVWDALIEVCDEKVTEFTEEIVSLKKQKEKNKLNLQVIKKLGNVPSKEELDRLLRYEGAIERQLYKAMNQLERLQRMRAGDDVPEPVEVDVDVSTSQNR
jgi:hypothetical protein